MAAPKRPYAPSLHIEDASEKDKNDTWQCSSCLSNLRSYCEDFESAVALFNFSGVHKRMWMNSPHKGMARQFGSWRLLAARDGAMSIYHFAKTLGGVDNWSRQSDVIQSHINKEKIREARRLLREKFPRLEAIRHSVAHRAEITSSQRWVDTHAFSGSFKNDALSIENSKNVIILNPLSNNVFTTTWEGTIIEYEVSKTSSEALDDVMIMYFESYSSMDRSARRK